MSRESFDVGTLPVTIGSIRAKAPIETGGQGALANVALRDRLSVRLRPENVRASEITGATLDVQRGDQLDTPVIEMGAIAVRGVRITVGDIFIFQHWRMTSAPAILIG